MAPTCAPTHWCRNQQYLIGVDVVVYNNLSCKAVDWVAATGIPQQYRIPLRDLVDAANVNKINIGCR